MSRYTTTDVRSISVYFFKKHRKLAADSWGSGSIVWSMDGEETGRIDYRISTIIPESHVELSYKTRRWDEDWRSIKYKVPLERVRCHFGGFRWYFRCSLYRNHSYCGQRVAVLYQIDDYFGCRRCADLTYDSCNEGKRFRGYPYKTLSRSFKAEEILEKVGYTHYRGRPTRKYRRYLKLMGGMSQERALNLLQMALGDGKM